MNDLETGNIGASEVKNLKERCAALQRQTINLLVALIVLTCTLAAFLYLQHKYAAQDLAYLKPLVRAYQLEKPGIDAFVAKLGEFGRTNRDFQPILSKYGIPIAVAPAAAAASIPSATGAPKPAPKK